MAASGIKKEVSEASTKEEISNGVKTDIPNGTKEDTSNGAKGEAKKDEKKEEGVDVGHKCELKALEERYNKEGAVEASELHAYKKGSKERFEDYALVTKQIYNKDQTLRTATLTVNSPHILSILREIVGVYATQPAGFDVPIVEEAPFALFYHYKDAIFAYEPKDEAVTEHHRLLMDWIDVEMSNVIKDVERLTNKGYITFSLLWTIFKPGELLFSSIYGHPRLYKLDTVAYKEIPHKGPMFEVNSRYVDYNGTTVGQAREKHQLYDKLIFTGKSPTKISTLDVFPRRFVDDDDLEERLTIRGKKLLELKGILTMQYDGLLMWLKLPPYAWWGPVCERDGVWTAISVSPLHPPGSSGSNGAKCQSDHRSCRIRQENIRRGLCRRSRTNRGGRPLLRCAEWFISLLSILNPKLTVKSLSPILCSLRTRRRLHRPQTLPALHHRLLPRPKSMVPTLHRPAPTHRLATQPHG